MKVKLFSFKATVSFLRPQEKRKQSQPSSNLGENSLGNKGRVKEYKYQN